MKTKTFLLACILVCLMYSAFSKGEFKIEAQNLIADSSNSTYSYFHINAGTVITIEGEIHYSDAWGFYIGPADSVHWFFNNNPAGITYGAQTINFSQPGIYSAIGYYAGTGYLTQEDIVLTVLSTTGITENTTSPFSIVENKQEHTLVINNFSSEKGFSASLYSLTGMLIVNSEVSLNSRLCTLPLNEISKGVYVVSIISDERKFSKKIVLDE